ncbi:hypothetical protein Tco_1308503 [Tanacetum coccineum]
MNKEGRRLLPKKVCQCGAHMMIRASTTSSGPFNQTFQNTKRSCHTKEVPCKDGCLLDIASYIMQNDMHTGVQKQTANTSKSVVINDGLNHFTDQGLWARSKVEDGLPRAIS